jgi:hypothetical protein
MYTIEHNKVFIALVATSSGRYDHHKASAIQNFKKLVKCSEPKCQVLWDPIYINASIC